MTKDVLRSGVRALELQIIKLNELYVSLRAQAFGFEPKKPHHTGSTRRN